jgi:CTD small phosphatase-like protein 2
VLSRDLDISELDTKNVLASLAWVKKVNKVEHSYKGKVLLKPQSLKDKGRMTLVLDLDETLVHSAIGRSKLPDYEFKFTMSYNYNDFELFVKKRPGVIEFLKKASKLFEIVIFTASQKIYADKVLDFIDPTRKWTRQRLFQDSCVNVDNNKFVKDLRVLGRDLKRVVIVDNAVDAFSFHLDNGIPIKSWFGESKDEELVKLFDFLVPLSQMDDVRPYLSQKFKLKERIGLS